MQMSSSYDLDDTTGADDERTPLLDSARSFRGGRGRRGPHNLRQTESQTFTRRSSYLNRFAACLVLTVMFLLVITAAIGFMFATSQPMTGIGIVSIGNVVTSEQVLMFDLTVEAHNPNIVV
ncbi:phospholipid metabolism enzyme, partial [Lasius niger]